MPKSVFFYATGTSYILGLFPTANGLFSVGNFPGITIPGYNGRNGYWKGPISNDPFPSMLDPYKWTGVKINYPAASFPMLNSIGSGVANTVNAINALPKGTPFALGGYSQGAAVMSFVLKNHLQSNAGTPSAGVLPNITSRYGDLKAGVMFGNPCRQAGKTWGAFKSYAGGQRVASTSNAGATTITNSVGCFPSQYRLTNTPSYWFEFAGVRENAVQGILANNTLDAATRAVITSFPGDSRVDIVTCIDPSSTDGANFIQGAGTLISSNIIGLLTDFVGTVAGFTNTLLTSVNNIGAAFATAGHQLYPAAPPNGYPATAPTCYQIALEYLDMIGSQNLNTAPSAIPSTTIGSTVNTVFGPIATLPVPGVTSGRGTPSGFRPVAPTAPLPSPNTGGRGIRR